MIVPPILSRNYEKIGWFLQRAFREVHVCLNFWFYSVKDLDWTNESHYVSALWFMDLQWENSNASSISYTGLFENGTVPSCSLTAHSTCSWFWTQLREMKAVCERREVYQRSKGLLSYTLFFMVSLVLIRNWTAFVCWWWEHWLDIPCTTLRADELRFITTSE